MAYEPSRAARLVSSAVGPLLLALLTPGCGASGSEARDCRSEGQASLCVDTGNGAFTVTGAGFQPGSDVGLNLDGGAGRLVSVGDDGRLPPPGASLALLPGPDLEEHRFEGVDAAGRPVVFLVLCLVDETRQSRCTF
ncbi:MAG: hypothetical protein AB1673_02780 [Actinomycetota bacterium]|jgi:hypothetical protein